MHVVITGGTRGIGQGMVLHFLKKGHNVTFTGTSQNSIDKHIDELEGNFLAIVCDVRNKSDIENVKTLAIEQFGNIDIWVNNAGVDQDRLDVASLREDEIKRVIDVNVTGMILGTSVALELMKQQGYGVVYNMEGLGSNNMTIPKTIIYGSSKHLLTYFSKGCNKELKAYDNIFVGRLQPGMVFTDLLMKNLGDDGMKVARIIGNKVEDVAPYLVLGMLKRKKHVKFPSMLRAFPRLFTMPFKKRDI
jgi:short-subunit dehydrogenase